MSVEVRWSKTERRVDGQWTLCSLEDLKKGDIFRMFEPITKIPIKDSERHTVFRAISDAFSELEPKGKFGITAEGIE